jgi:hypothetical protein
MKMRDEVKVLLAVNILGVILLFGYEHMLAAGACVVGVAVVMFIVGLLATMAKRRLPVSVFAVWGIGAPLVAIFLCRQMPTHDQTICMAVLGGTAALFFSICEALSL